MAKTPAKRAANEAPKPPVNASVPTPPVSAPAPAATAAAPAPDEASGGSQGDNVPGGDLSTADSGQASGSQDAGQTELQASAAPVAPAAPRGHRPDTTTRPYVVGTVPIRHNGEVYGVGFEIELTTTEADRLDGMVVPLPEGKE